MSKEQKTSHPSPKNWNHIDTKTSLQLVLFLNRDSSPSLNCDHTCKFLPRKRYFPEGNWDVVLKKKEEIENRRLPEKYNRHLVMAAAPTLKKYNQIIMITRFLEEKKRISGILPISIFLKNGWFICLVRHEMDFESIKQPK